MCTVCANALCHHLVVFFRFFFLIFKPVVTNFFPLDKNNFLKMRISSFVSEFAHHPCYRRRIVKLTMPRSGFWMHKRRCRHSTSLRQHVKRQWAHVSSVCSFPQNVNVCHACLVLLRWRRLVGIFRICAFHVWLALIRITLCFGCFERNLVQLVPRQCVSCCNIARSPLSAHYLSRGTRTLVWCVPRSVNGHFRFQLLCQEHLQRNDISCPT